jgi:hypothetical protein
MVLALTARSNAEFIHRCVQRRAKRCDFLRFEQRRHGIAVAAEMLAHFWIVELGPAHLVRNLFTLKST